MLSILQGQLIALLIICLEIICNPSFYYIHRCLCYQCPFHPNCYKWWHCQIWTGHPQASAGYYRLGSATSSWRSYNSGIRHYITFCNQANKPSVPTSESTLLLFVSYLASRNLSYPTIKDLVYLAGVRSLYVVTGYDVTFHSHLTPCHHQVLKGIRKEKASTLPSRIHRPITRDIMLEIKGALLKSPHSYHNIMMWAACCLAFFGFLRSSEFTIPTQSSYDPEVHLSVKDVAVDNRTKLRMLKVKIKQ